MEIGKKIWSKRYRPTDMDDYIFPSEEIKRRVEDFISDGIIPNLFFYGQPGTGKTTLALLLKKYMGVEDMDFLKIDGSKQNSVDVVRDTIYEFAKLAPVSDCGFKLIYIDECDYLSQNAQGTLRDITEDRTDNVRFIFSCNYVHKIIPALRSRWEEFEFKSLDKEQMFLRVLKILDDNNIKCDSDPELDMLQELLESTFPDFRKFIDKTRSKVSKGKLVLGEQTSDASIMEKVELLEMVSKSSIDWSSVRARVMDGISDDEFLEYYRFFYEYLHDTTKFTDVNKWKAGIIVIADSMYRHSIVSDQEINFMSMLIKLQSI